MLNELYQPPLALLTDLYQLTMAYGYWKLGRADQHAVFHLFFRKPPFRGGYAVAAGLEQALQYLERFRFEQSDLDYLGSLTGNDGAPLFEQAFLDYLGQTKLSVDVDAVQEGTVTFGQEPLLRVRGPILQCQLLETPLLNLINFQTLIATKSARIATAAGDDPILEFGLRRAQGIDGALSASRAAYIGGSTATSNVLAGKMFGIPVKGTHAHSWVMSFDTEAEAFAQYAAAMPNNCVFLVDTYDTLDGVRQACKVGKKLREQGHEMVGIRLDSGDLAYLSIEARKILDEAGFPKAAIVASNDLDEHIIENLKSQGSQIAIWGVGTKLATAFDQPALGGVYKLAAIQQADGTWQPKVKLSEQAIKTSIPGTLQVRRYMEDGRMVGDMIYDEQVGVDPRRVIVDSKDATRRKRLAETTSVELLRPAMQGGKRVAMAESLKDIRERAQRQLASLHPTIRRFMNPHEYPVGLDIGLHELRDNMIHEARQARWQAEEDPS
ncbi:nicotinate phosphoribosyltransferase [Bremerella cremea]|uniref:Nicotinate phosphoribosyltransferase n=1 Tax=Blastopirellula marina TaxID=124 RepID=A0A2S8G844_9BACT|nr:MULTISPECIES: nicotinate phosphoribosyltransferase [Pirellulaceae]PQO40470.1 nicotinate phosphoribosyltransferase [Blastopirellula marina]RCS52052.1 nicotinate phosphoribosyltransferase [Bremerella cremea]